MALDELVDVGFGGGERFDLKKKGGTMEKERLELLVKKQVAQSPAVSSKRMDHKNFTSRVLLCTEL